ncbi:MAG TPA: aryl-sulfate sulfotransferase N-terminal domain-containing protein, partial [Ilumatobacteraceae bacterium]
MGWLQHRRGAFVAVAALGVAVAACSSSSSSSAPSASTTAPSAVTSAASSSTTVGTSAAPVTVASTAASSPSADTSGSTPSSATLQVTAAPIATNVLSAQLQITSPVPVAVQVEATSSDHSVSVPRTTAASTTQSIPLIGMRASHTYTITVSAFDKSGAAAGTASTTFTTGALPSFIPQYDFVGDKTKMSPGITLVELIPQGGTTPPPGYILGID